MDAGNERFSAELMHRYFDELARRIGVSRDELMNLGTRPGTSGDFEMTLLALNHAVRSNGVSRLHGSVSRAMWQFNWKGVPAEEIPIGYITNGVHLNSFAGRPAAALLATAVGADWNSLPPQSPQWRKVSQIADADFWQAKQEQKKILLELLKKTSPKAFHKFILDMEGASFRVIKPYFETWLLTYDVTN